LLLLPSASRWRDLDRYDFLGIHGRGGLGKVSRVHDRELGRDIAIKELISRGHVSEVRFLREALITARLEHPSIVPVYEAGRWPDGTPFYAMKLISGRPLRDLISEYTTVDERIGLLHHVIAVADAIAYAHRRNIIHRDLKPANVIVGEFGETVVIDWGLAKDLTAAEDSTSAGGSNCANADDGLTSAGTILGTPAYMPPEQQRGEAVDQRADVFAIGAMLWELLSLKRLPPAYTQQRRRILREAGIDADLVAIADKALDPDPDRRYPDAGALAADLKAFKAGARIAARRYSLFAMLSHWTRRHRALTLSVALATFIASLGIVLYVRDVTIQRDRADASEEIARRSTRAAEASLDDLTLKHAELLLTTDPSAAMEALVGYRSSKADKAALITATAIGMGVATLRIKPHTDSIRWATGTADGSIVSMSTDGTITRTFRDKTSVVLAKGVSTRGRFAYAPLRGLLAYGCDPANVCVWDVRRGQPVPLPAAFRDWQLARVVFSQSESRLALLSFDGLVRAFDISSPERPLQLLELKRSDGIGLLFADDDTLIIGLSNDGGGLELASMNGSTQTLMIHDNFQWDAIPSEHRIILATQHGGDGLQIAAAPLRIVSHTQLCHGAPTGLKVLPGKHVAAYSCRDGTVGTWDLEGQTVVPIMHMDGHVDAIATSSAGDYLMAAGGNGSLAVVDLKTNLTSSYRGHEFRVTALVPPTQQYPYFISGDVRGSVRAWPLPTPAVRVSANVHTRFQSGFFNQASGDFVAATFQTELTVLSATNSLRGISPHQGRATFLQPSDSGATFAAYGESEAIELWDARSLTRSRVIISEQGAISRLLFLPGAEAFVTAGRDGSLVYWSATGEKQRIVTLGVPVIDFVLDHRGRSAVISVADGSVWRTDADRLVRMRDAGPSIVRMVGAAAVGEIAVADASGDVVLVDTNSWQQTRILHTAQAIRDIAFSVDGRVIAIAGNDDTIYIARDDDVAWNSHRPQWMTFSARAQAVALTPDGILVALISNGSILVYSPSSHAWASFPTGTSDLTTVRISNQGERAAVLDTDGRIIQLDLSWVRRMLADSQANRVAK
jgi:WD40 repeat protein